MNKHTISALSKCARRAPGESVTLTDADDVYKDEKAHAREVMEKARVP